MGETDMMQCPHQPLATPSKRHSDPVHTETANVTFAQDPLAEDVDAEASITSAYTVTMPASPSAPSASAASHLRPVSRLFSEVHSVVMQVGVTVTFDDICVEVKNAKDKQPLTLLDGVSGALMAGQMTALMGPSGSGKTTLLDVLSGRKSTGLTSGTILYGGSAPTKAYLRAATGYVEQHTTLIPEFTVYEMLLYTAEMKRPWKEAHSTKVEVVQGLLERLQLTNCSHVVIGDAMTKGISGGQAKRVSIGVAMVCVPPVLYLDEPTSGLDSQSAYEIMDLIHKAAQDGTTVAVAIHSPRPDVFAMFDMAIALAQGKIVYMGGTSESHMSQFKALSSQWLTDAEDKARLPSLLLHAAATATSKGTAHELAKAFQSSRFAPSEMQQRLKKINTPIPAARAAALEASPSKAGHSSSVSEMSSATPRLSDTPIWQQQPERIALVQPANVTPFWWAILMLCKHRALRNWKRIAWYLPRMLDKCVFAFVIISLYYGQGKKTDTTYVVNISASLFMWVSLPTVAAFGYIPSIIQERPLFNRERADGLYNPISYISYKALEELTAAGLISLAFSPMVFYVVQFLGSFVLFWLAYFFTVGVSILIAHAFASFSPNFDLAHVTLSLVITSFMFTAGQLATLSTMPVYWRWWSRINFVRYAWSAIMLNQFENSDLIFTAQGETVLQYLGVTGGKWENLFIMLAFMGGYFLIALVGLTFVNHAKR